MISPNELRDLAEMSARIGRDAALVQGPGGNTSLKDERELWVKSSGYWLAEALDKDIFVPIDLDVLRAAGMICEVPAHAVLSGRAADHLRPSIETALHALMPQRAVVHAHAVNAMTVSVLEQGRAFAEERLGGLRWAWVDYCRPGAALAGAVQRVLAEQDCDVLLLQNHGVVVGAPSPAKAEELLVDVERRLALDARSMPDAEQIALDPGAYAWHPEASRLAHDAQATQVLTQAPLIPDQIVFLGGAVPIVADAAALEEACLASVLVLWPGVGAFARRDRSRAADVMIDSLIAIAMRVPLGAPVRGLTQEDVDALLGWDAERHRQALNVT